MTLIKSFYSGDPEVIQKHADLQKHQLGNKPISLGRVPALDAGDPGSIPGGGKLIVCLQGALLWSSFSIVHY
jgi:hypothetical protein